MFKFRRNFLIISKVILVIFIIVNMLLAHEVKIF